MTYVNKFVAVVSVKNQILRESRINEVDHVYLPFGTDYSIKLKNLNSVKAIVNVEIDGADVLGGSSIVIGSNKEHKLEGFLKNNKIKNKFRFIKKSDEISNFRGDKIDDSLIRISVRYEKVIKMVDWHKYCEPVEDKPIVRKPNPWDLTWYHCDDRTYGVLSNCQCDISCSSDKLADYGITVKGKEVDVDYETVSINDLESKTDVILIKLCGTNEQKTVTRPKTARRKSVCSTCGRKNTTKNKFCFNCGTFLND